MEWILNLGGSFAGAALVGGVAWFLYKEHFKSQLIRLGNLEIARVSAELGFAAEKSHIQHRLMAARQIEVIAEVFGAMHKTRVAMTRLASLSQEVAVDPEDDNPHKFRDALNKHMVKQFSAASDEFRSFDDIYSRNRIFLPTDVCSQIDELIHKFVGVHVDMQDVLEWDDDDDPAQRKERLELKRQAWNEASGAIPEITKNLEDKFRHMSGAD